MIQVHHDLNTLPRFKNAVITIGTYDGVHLGHQQIIKYLKAEAEAIEGETIIITFNPHPRKVIGRGTKDVKLINTLQEKIELLDKQGIEHVVIVAFNETFANQPAEEYVKNFLVDKFHPRTIIIGYDHKFGKSRQGDYHLLEDLGKKYNYSVKEIPEHILNEAIISSTRVREALLKGDVETANKLLGYEYFIEGTVVEGSKLGRTIGYPTANIRVQDEEKLVPGNGVYAVTVNIGDKILGGMMNIGLRPTVDGSNRTIELNIFEFDENIYGQIIRVSVRYYLRGEKKFSSLEELKDQLGKDKINALEVLKS